MRIKKAGILIIAAAITCTTPAVPAMAADTSESVQEIISDNEIDSLVSDPDKVVDIIMYVKNEAAKQDISDDQIRSLIQTAESLHRYRVHRGGQRLSAQNPAAPKRSSDGQELYRAFTDSQALREKAVYTRP